MLPIQNKNYTFKLRTVEILYLNLYRCFSRCELYQKTEIEFRELENIMAWLSTLGGAFSSLGDQTKHCVNNTILIKYISVLSC